MSQTNGNPVVIGDADRPRHRPEKVAIRMTESGLPCVGIFSWVVPEKTGLVPCVGGAAERVRTSDQRVATVDVPL